MKIISIVNQKGGVGKTTTASNLSTAISTIEKKVLLIDLDSQGNASTGFGFLEKDKLKTIYDVISDNCDIKDAIHNTCIPNLDIIPSNIHLSGLEIEVANLYQKELMLKKKFEEIGNGYDYIFIDCPPSLGILTINSLAASNSVLIPMQCEFYSLEGLSHLLNTIEIVKERLNPYLEIEGILLTMHDKRYRLTELVEEDVRNCLGDTVFQTIIPRNVKVSEAPSHGKPVLLYDHKSSGAIAYINLAKELLQREKELI
jgi:chromosome partitioning protein